MKKKKPETLADAVAHVRKMMRMWTGTNDYSGPTVFDEYTKECLLRLVKEFDK